MNKLRDDLHWVELTRKILVNISLLNNGGLKRIQCCALIYKHGQIIWRIIFPLYLKTSWKCCRVCNVGRSINVLTIGKRIGCRNSRKYCKKKSGVCLQRHMEQLCSWEVGGSAVLMSALPFQRNTFQRASSNYL